MDADQLVAKLREVREARKKQKVSSKKKPVNEFARRLDTFNKNQMLAEGVMMELLSNGEKNINTYQMEVMSEAVDNSDLYDRLIYSESFARRMTDKEEAVALVLWDLNKLPKDFALQRMGVSC